MSTESVMDHHIDALLAEPFDIEEVMKDYTEDSTLITPNGAVSGLDNLRSSFAGFAGMMAGDGQFDLTQKHVDGEMGYIAWTLESSAVSVPLGSDTFLVRDDKIVTQTFAGAITPKG